MSTLAQVQVISTTELLEHILAQLPLRDLLITAPLVSKTWRAVTFSPTLQHVLFFDTLVPAFASSERIQNPLLVELFPPFFAFRPGENNAEAWPGDTDSLTAMPWARSPEAFKRAEASWRRMFVTQPPVQSVVIKQTSYGPAGASDRQGVLNDVALRMGALYDLTVSLIDDDSMFFRIEWSNANSNTGADLKEGDLTLFVTCSTGCMDEFEPLDARFLSDGAEDVEVDFREWNMQMWD
ncbi:hypothetical protein B0H14DRAFT_1356727 [Mycena olivaceomarginata]|nr:hypothetical protein B0H14DRAFT_1356727 [Mycena olivaceomarginata]